MSTKLFNTLSTAGSILLLGVVSTSVSYAGPVFWPFPPETCDKCTDPTACVYNLDAVNPDLTLNSGDCAGAKVICVTGHAGNNIIDTSEVNLPTCVKAGVGDNTITTGDADDEVYSGAGKDEIITGGGNDYIDAGDGGTYKVAWQIIKAGRGDDMIIAGAGDDLILGQAGDDDINAGAGDNRVLGGSGDDEIVAGAGDDDIRGQSGCDYIDAGPAPGVDEIKGGGSTIKCSNPVTDSAEDALCTELGTINGQGGRDRCYTNGTAKCEIVQPVGVGPYFCPW